MKRDLFCYQNRLLNVDLYLFLTLQIIIVANADAFSFDLHTLSYNQRSGGLLKTDFVLGDGLKY